MIAEILQESFDQKLNDAQKLAQDANLFLKNSPDGPDKKNAGKKSVDATKKEIPDSTNKLPTIIPVKEEKANADDIKLLKERIEQAKKDAAAKRAGQGTSK